MPVHQNSITTYHQIRDEGLLSKRRFQIYEVLHLYGKLTATQIAQRVDGYKSPASGMNVSARLFELREMGVVREVENVICPVSGRLVILWETTDNLPTKPKTDQKETKAQLLKELYGMVEIMCEHLDARSDIPEVWKDWSMRCASILNQLKEKKRDQSKVEN